MSAPPSCDGLAGAGLAAHEALPVEAAGVQSRGYSLRQQQFTDGQCRAVRSYPIEPGLDFAWSCRPGAGVVEWLEVAVQNHAFTTGETNQHACGVQPGVGARHGVRAHRQDLTEPRLASPSMTT
jgi:hypothetical protein